MTLKEQTQKNIQLGLFVMAAAMLLIAAVYLIGANKNLFGSNFSISTIMTDAGGLQVGNNVHYAGINVGTVERISIISDSTLRVDLKLVNRVKPFIKKDAVARITIDGIVGSTLISISPGNGAAPAIEEGDILQAAKIPGTSDLISTLGNTNLDIAKFVKELLEISGTIREGPGTVNRLLEDSLMASDLSQSIKNLNLSTRHTLTMIKQLERSVNKIEQNQGLLNQLINDTIIISNLKQVATNLNKSVPGKLDSVIAHLENTGSNLADASRQLNEILQAIKTGDGPISELLYDPEMTRTIEKTLQNIEKGTAKFDEDMEALKHNFLFRRYFRKQEKQRKKDSLTNQP